MLNEHDFYVTFMFFVPVKSLQLFNDSVTQNGYVQTFFMLSVCMFLWERRQIRSNYKFSPFIIKMVRISN